MKGVILAGGYGTRLMPLTKVTNKHLLPVYNKPMIYYPLQTLTNAGIKKIMIITGPENCGDFLKLLGSGREFGAELTYRIQDEAGGIAQALGLAEDFINGEKCVAILGDNIFEDEIKKYVEQFEKEEKGAMIFLKEVQDAARFGVATIKENKLIEIEEKPKNPKSNLAVTGLYFYDSNVFNFIKGLRPSARGELELTDVNNEYIKRNSMKFIILNGFWTDAGTFETLKKATEFVSELNKRS